MLSEDIKRRVPSWIRTEGKEGIIKEVWTGQAPGQIAYFVGVRAVVSPDQMQAVALSFFNEQPQNPQRPQLIMAGQSSWLPMLPTIIVIVNPDHIPLEVMLPGMVGRRVCPLYSVGQEGQKGYVNFAIPESSAIDRV